MAIVPIAHPLPAQAAGPLEDPFFDNMKEVACLVAQIGVRFFFIAGSIIMAAAAFPVSFHAVALPTVAFGATFLAGFFYQAPVQIPFAQFFDMGPLIRPAQGQPVPDNLRAEAPRGLVNISNNCWLIALVGALEADPEFAEWARHPLPPYADLETFVNFLAEYEAPAPIVAAFRDFVAEQEAPALPVPVLFTEFLNTHVPAENVRPEFNNLKGIYERLLAIQGPLANFFAHYDDPAAQPDVQALRTALSQISPLVDPSPHVQMDAAESMGVLLDLLPNRMKLHIEETYRVDVHGTRPLRDNPAGLIQKSVHQGSMELAFPPNEEAPQVESLLQHHCEAQTTLELYGDDGRKRKYPAREQRRFRAAPSVLRLQIKRFEWVKLPDSWLNRFKCWLWPEMGWVSVKREDRVEVPERLTIPLVSGQEKRYKLASVIEHRGSSINSGHYVAGREVQERKYLLNDNRVTVLDQPERDELVRKAYLLFYREVQG